MTLKSIRFSPTIIGPIFGGFSLAVASWLPETWLGFFSGLVTAVLFALTVEKSSKPGRSLYLGGIVFSALAFYWLPETISFFGGFPQPIAWLFFALFCLTSALQFLLSGWLFGILRHSILYTYGLAFPIAWLATELAVPRLFPWAIGHSLIIWSDIAGLAEITGVPLLSALLCWWGALGAKTILSILSPDSQGNSGYPGAVRNLAFAGGSALLLVISGHFLNARVSARLTQAPSVVAALIQGNLDAKQKGDVKYFDVNIQRYRELSVQAAESGADIIIWPESVSNYWTPEGIANVRNSELDPMPGNNLPLLYGGLSFRERSPEEIERILSANPSLRTKKFIEQLRYHRFNSAFGLDQEGSILGKYHKRILMPFGEYIPFSSQFPWLKTVMPQTGDFSVGDLSAPIVFKNVGPEKHTVKAAILICYEDLIPELSASAILDKANILVNLTNDAWYGDTSAPHQHHLLAQWRAIESRRYLLRVTNTGLTATVNPFGRTVEKLNTFSAGYALSKVELLEDFTLYSKIGDTPAWILVTLAIIIGLWSRKNNHRARGAHRER